MAPLKFRAWDRTEREMIVPALLVQNVGYGDGSLIVNEKAERGNELDWMQWTGLKDKNGVEIYEGDVVRWDDASRGKYWRVAEVVWSKNGCWCFRTIPGQCVGCLKYGRQDFLMGSFIYTPDTADHGNIMEIIGNIHENPELLTEQL